MPNVLISIIVPCYNQAQYLDECLQSVLDQTYHDWECIIVNDGSPDNTEEFAQKWVEKDSRFKYFYKENGGLSTARNFGIEKAAGEWILPLDCDDLIANKYLELSNEEITKGFNLIYFKIRLFGQENLDYDTAFYNFEELLYSNPFYCSCIFPKEKWKKLGGYDEKLIYGMEDWEFWINMIYNTPTIVSRVDYVGFLYRKKENSMLDTLQVDVEKQIYSKSYIIQKHANHYAKSQTFVAQNLKNVQEYKTIIEKYQKMFSENIFLSTINKIRKILKVKI